MASRTIESGLQGGRALKKYLKGISDALGDGTEVQVGFFEDATYSGGKRSFTKKRKKKMSPGGREFAEFLEGKEKFSGPVATVAAWNEFGTEKSPPRPFMRKTVATKSPRWGNGLGRALRDNNYDAYEALHVLGEVIQGQMRQSIIDFRDPPNAQLTQDIKGFNDPLVDSGRMLRSVDFQITGIDGE